MNKFIHDFRILSNEELTPGLHLLKLTPECESLPDIRPGQFVNISAPAASGKLIRRPISICDVDYDNSILTLMVKVAGKGTEAICRTQQGEILNIVYPLGNGFSIPEKKSRVLLIGGGVGIAPLLYYAKCLRQEDHQVTILLGGRSASDICLLNAFKECGDVCITTQDGSCGVCGMVTDHEALNCEYDIVSCCGPTPMMKAVGEICKKRDIRCEVSLENSMACGIGACLCCVQKTSDGHNTCVCTNGPVFDYTNISI